MRSPMISEPHRIQRQVIELDLPAGMAAPELQERLAREWRDRVLPALSRLRCHRGRGPRAAAGPAGTRPRHGHGQRLGATAGRAAAGADRGGTGAASGVDGDIARRVERGERADEGVRVLPRTRAVAVGRGDRPDGGFSAILAGPGAIAWPALQAVLGDAAPARGRLVQRLDDAQLAAGVMAWRGVPSADDVLRGMDARGCGAVRRRAWRRGFWRILVAWAVQGASNDATAPLIAPLLAAHREVFGAPSMSRRLRTHRR